jgi:predicted nicotinamide N-methyase
MWINPSPPPAGALAPLAIATDRSAGHGGIVWDAALVLAWFVATTPACLSVAALPGSASCASGLRVAELGAGCGLPGLAAARAHGCRVALLDKPALVPLLAANVEANALGHLCTAAPLVFGGALARLPPAARPPWDVLLASDVLGCADAGAFTGLLKTLRDAFAANPSTVVLMSYRRRAAWEADFFARATGDEGWACDRVAALRAGDVARLKAAALVCLQPELGEAPGALERLLEGGGGASDAGADADVHVFRLTFPSRARGVHVGLGSAEAQSQLQP